jgi:uncharacterized membrane protein YjfL (UPF0719 family)
MPRGIRVGDFLEKEGARVVARSLTVIERGAQCAADLSMKKVPLVGLFSLLATPAAFGSVEVQPASWHAETLLHAISYMLLFAFIGIGAAVLGYKIFDKCTPGDLHKEIVENKNQAAAIVAGAVILGVCIIIAAAMLG